MTTFLKGDTTAAITLALADGFDYSGKTVNLEYQGVRRTFTGCVAGGTLTFAFAAEETAPMSLGAYPVRVWIEGGGEVLTVHNADVKLRVTDCIADVHGGGAIYLDVHGGLHGIEGLPERFTDEDLRSKVNEIVRRLGGVAALLVLFALPAVGASVTVQTARKGSIYNDGLVVTNVQLDTSGLLTEHQDISGKADKADTYTKAETDAKIVELAPAPGNYATVSNKAMTAIQEHQSLWPAVAASTNYADAIAAAFENGDRSVQYANNSGHTDYAVQLYNEDASGLYNASDLIRAATNAAKAVVGPAAVAATNYTDSAICELARTNNVLKKGPYVLKTSESANGQNMYGGFRIRGWLSATGTVSSTYGGPTMLEMRSPSAWMDYDSFNLGWGTGGWTFDAEGFHRHLHGGVFEPFTNGPAIKFPEDAYETGGTLALRSDIPIVQDWAKAQSKPTYTASEVGATDADTVTNIVRDISRGGIWDSQLEVWWTPIMENGALKYVATTNVDLNAGN